MSAVVTATPPALPVWANETERRLVERAANSRAEHLAASRPASDDAIVTALRPLLAAMPSAAAADDETADDRTDGYLIGLRGVSRSGLASAVQKFLTTDRGRPFAPTPGELRAEADRHDGFSRRMAERCAAEIDTVVGLVEDARASRTDGSDEAAERMAAAARIRAAHGFGPKSGVAPPERKAEAKAKLEEWAQEVAGDTAPASAVGSNPGIERMLRQRDPLAPKPVSSRSQEEAACAE